MRSLEHPYTNVSKGKWLRGNLHAHTTRSDGARAPQPVLDDYAARGYDFLMLSDHDIFTSTPDLAGWDARGMVLIPGNEITANGSHILHVNAGTFVPPHVQRQRSLTEVSADAGSFAVVAHPNWLANFDHTTITQLREWVGYTGIEIYNGTIGRLEGSPYSTNKWDMLLARGRRIWGYANDDSHLAEGDTGLGWNMVCAGSRNVEAIVGALRKGCFYASTGVEITGIEVHEFTIRITASNARKIVALQQTGRRFAESNGDTIEVQVPQDATYVRFECWGDGESFAWTQPFFVVED